MKARYGREGDGNPVKKRRTDECEYAERVMSAKPHERGKKRRWVSTLPVTAQVKRRLS